ARALRADRLALRRGRTDALVEAARTLDDEAAVLGTALGSARSGFLLCDPAGTTRWKNERFDATLAHLCCDAPGDLARVVALCRRSGESSTEALERLLESGAPARVGITGARHNEGLVL